MVCFLLVAYCYGPDPLWLVQLQQTMTNPIAVILNTQTKKHAQTQTKTKTKYFDVSLYATTTDGTNQSFKTILQPKNATTVCIVS